LDVEIDSDGQEIRAHHLGGGYAKPSREVDATGDPLALTRIVVVEDVRRPRSASLPRST